MEGPGQRLEISHFLGPGTNNIAEYSALIAGLQAAVERGATHVDVRGDSELVVKQLNGIYKVKAEHLQPLHAKALELLKEIGSFDVSHVYREHNSEADRLASKAIEAAKGMGASS